MMFLRVLLPAPCTPTVAKISLFSTENEMLSFARFPGNILEILRTSNAFMASLPHSGGEGRYCRSWRQNLHSLVHNQARHERDPAQSGPLTIRRHDDWCRCDYRTRGLYFHPFSPLQDWLLSSHYILNGIKTSKHKALYRLTIE